MKEQPKESPENGLRESTLRDYGHKLIVGLADKSGKIGRDFAFREIDYETEVEIDKARNKKGGPGSHHAKVASEVLATVLTQWADDRSFGTKAHEHKLAVLAHSAHEDLMYAWICLRVATMGASFGINHECPSCGEQSPWETDLEGMKITIADGPIKPVAMKLLRPVSWGQTSLVKVWLEPSKWGAVTEIKLVPNRNSLDDVKMSLLFSSVHHFESKDGAEVPPAKRAFELMRKLDRERAIKLLDGDMFPSCDLQLEIDCPKCGHVHTTPLPWTWDFFFGASSLPTG